MSTERKKQKESKEDYEKELKTEFDRWEYLNEHGGSDPFWSDGCNMELVRNHIEYYKRKIEEFGEPYPEIYYRDTPPETNRNYMARPEEIRENAEKALAEFEKNGDLQYVRNEASMLSYKDAERLRIPYVLGYENTLRSAIASGDLLTMRRYGNPRSYIESFEQTARALRQFKPTEDVQLSLF